jgi:hypothetical protein
MLRLFKQKTVVGAMGNWHQSGPGEYWTIGKTSKEPPVAMKVASQHPIVWSRERDSVAMVPFGPPQC